MLLSNTIKFSEENKNKISKKKIAVVTDQISGGIGGAESITFGMARMYADAHIYATVVDKDILPADILQRGIKTTFIQNLPLCKKLYKAYLPLMPAAVEYLDLQEYDIIFSSHHCVAKGIIPRPDAVHICYCHSPARYIWDLFWTYHELNGVNQFTKYLSSFICNYLRIWDVTSSARVDKFIANSSYTASRIKKFYNRDCEILHPPVDTNKFSHQGYGDYYLMISRLVGYKRFDLTIEAFNENGKNLVIIGDGAEFEKYKKIAKPNVKLLGKVSDEVLAQYMNNCKGFIFPGKEDFGIVMGEAQAAGKPVIAFKGGGALDIVIEGETGILFEEQTVESLGNAIKICEKKEWDNNLIEASAKRFDKEKFNERLKQIIENSY